MTDRREFLALPRSWPARIGTATALLVAALFATGAVIAGRVPITFFQAVGSASMEPAILGAKTSDASCTASRQASLFAIDYLTLHFRAHRRLLALPALPLGLRRRR